MKKLGSVAVLMVMFCLLMPAGDWAQDNTNEETPEVATRPLVLDLIVEQSEVSIGAKFNFVVRVLNISDKIQEIRELDFHYDAISLKAKYQGKEFELGHAAGKSAKGSIFSKKTEFDTFTIKPGRSSKFCFSLPAVAVGDYEFTAVFKPGEDEDTYESINSSKVTVGEFQDNNARVLRIETNKGAIVFQLYPGYALNTVTHMAQLVRESFFDKLTFHRILPNHVIQGGDPRKDGSGGPGYQIKAEFSDDVKHELGTISMARGSQVDSAGCQFYISSKEFPEWDDPQKPDNRYTVWGKAIEGEELITELTAIPLKKDTDEYQQKDRDIRQKTKLNEPAEKRQKEIKRLLNQLEKTREQPSEIITIKKMTMEYRKLEIIPVDKGDNKKEKEGGGK
ncbi:peptidylprolyl isomerase [Planctomycetota bacterium]